MRLHAIEWGLVGTLAAGIVAAGCGSETVGQTVLGEKNPITLCHRTHSATNPVVKITVSNNAQRAHHVNHGDFEFDPTQYDDQCQPIGEPGCEQTCENAYQKCIVGAGNDPDVMAGCAVDREQCLCRCDPNCDNPT
jgi:hypothetical protein